MAKGVAKIQNSPQSLFALVRAHHLRFYLAAAFYCMCQQRSVACAQAVHVCLNPVKKHHIGNRPVFDDFGQPSRHLTRGQRLQRVQVAHHQRGLVKSPNHVFTQGVVNGRFAAHRRVYLCQQRSGHLHKWHTAHVAGCGKTRHVAHHAAAQRKQQRFAVTALRQQRIKNQVQRLPVFMRFAIRQAHRMNMPVLALQRSCQALRIQRCHRGVADNQRVRGLGQACIRSCVAQQARANGDSVSAITQRNRYRRGG